MDQNTAWTAESRAAAAVAASTAVLDSLAGAGVGRSDPRVVDSLDLAFLAGADALDCANPLRELADSCLDGLAEVARLEARTAALKATLAADYVHAARALAPPASSPQESTAHELALLAEVACVLTVSERTAGAFLADAQALTMGLPLTLAALQSGTISWQHARIIIDETGSLDPAATAGLEAHFLDPDAPNPARGCPAGDLVPSRFRAKARTWRERHHPVSIEERHTKSAGDRRLEYHPDRDGMAWLSAHLPADTAAGIWERTTAAARALQGPAETRTLAQLRADITATWLLTNNTPGTSAGMPDGGAGLGMSVGGAGLVPSPRAQVLISVPVLSLLGATEEPAILDGYGPIPPSMARALVADGADSFHRVLTDPRDGAPLEIGRTSYRLTTAMRQWLRLRDGKCPFPGCNNHSLDNEADHLLAWADGGTTGISNLGQPCPKHHRLKHGSGWTPTPASKDHPPGWTSPSQRHYPSEHQDWEPPRWPHPTPITDTGPDHELPGYAERHTVPSDSRQPKNSGQPGQDPEPELPPDPFPDWCSFTAAHPWPDTDTDTDTEDEVEIDDNIEIDDADDKDNPGWTAPLNDSFPEYAAYQRA